LKKVLRVSINNCTGCQSCVVTCSLVKDKVFSKKKSMISILKDESRCLGIPMICEHCETPACIDVCPVDAISKDPETGIVRVDSELCTGCELCRPACPFGEEIIKMSGGVAVKCDLCGGEPACVEVCQQKALQYVMATKQNVRVKEEWADNRAKAIAALRGV
jgi:carbon-monoxide dehydrogenase iron sulfur subunit